MAKQTKRQKSRKEEIMSAALQLFQDKYFSEFTIKDIGALTSCSRTSIYNYFQTKEEIFLSIITSEYNAWIVDLDSLLHKSEVPSRKQLAKQIAASLKKRELLLKIASSDLNGIIASSRSEFTSEYEAAKKNAAETLQKVLKRFCSELNAKTLPLRANSLLVVMHGIYAQAGSANQDILTDTFDKLLSI